MTAEQIRILKERTGAGLLDCKKALLEAGEDMEKAAALLEKRGLAAKKEDALPTEGRIAVFLTEDGTAGAVAEADAETDYTAKSSAFGAYVRAIAEQAAETEAQTTEEFLTEPWKREPSLSVGEALEKQAAECGEALNLRRFLKYRRSEKGVLFGYTHGGGRIGVLLELTAEKPESIPEEAGKNIALQIAAMAPENTFSLYTQAFIKGEGESVSAYLDGVSKEAGCSVNVFRFARFEAGEGLEHADDSMCLLRCMAKRNTRAE